MTFVGTTSRPGRAMGVRERLLLLVVAASLPILVVSLVLMGRLAVSERDAQNQTLLYTAQSLRSALDAEAADKAAAGFAQLLQRTPLPLAWRAALLDRDGRLIAPSPGDGGAEWAARAASAAQDGLVEPDAENATAIARAVSRTGRWMIVVAPSAEPWGEPYRRAILLTILGGLAMIMAAAMLAEWVALRLTTPLKTLQEGAEALEHGVPLVAQETGIPEFDRAIDTVDNATNRLLQHERVLEESALRMSLAQDAALAGVWEWRLADDRNIWTEPVWTLYGLSPDAVKASFEAWVSAIHPADRVRTIATVREAADSGKEFEIQWRVNLPVAAGERWLLSRGRPHFGADGQLEKYVGIAIDISQRKRMEESLRQSERRIAAIIDALPIGVALVDAAGQTIICNEFYRRLVPRFVPSRDDERVALWKGDDEAGRPLARADYPAARALRGERVWPGQVFLYHGDAARGPFWTRVAAIPLRADDGAITGATVVIADIDDERRAEAALRAREDEFRAFFETAAVGAVELRLDGHFLKTNSRFRVITGYSETELAALTPTDLTHPDDRPHDTVLLQAFLAGEIPTYFSRKRFVRKDGRIVWVEVTAAMVVDADGNRLRTAGIVQDITDRKKAEDALRDSEARLLHASRLSEIGQMAAALAHELNQPLTAVVSYMGGGRRILAGETCDTDCRHRLIGVMEQAGAQAMRAGEIIRRLREFVRVGESEKAIENASAVLRDASFLATVAAKHSGVVIELEFEECGDVLVDKIQIQQVVLNLVRNAIEAMAGTPRKQLTLSLRAQPERIEFAVSDTGAGLSDEMIDRLFSPFSSTKDTGMGIGLSVCREIIEAHGGKIWAEANATGGTTFRFTLPLMLPGDLPEPG